MQGAGRAGGHLAAQGRKFRRLRGGRRRLRGGRRRRLRRLRSTLFLRNVGSEGIPLGTRASSPRRGQDALAPSPRARRVRSPDASWVPCRPRSPHAYARHLQQFPLRRTVRSPPLGTRASSPRNRFALGRTVAVRRPIAHQRLVTQSRPRRTGEHSYFSAQPAWSMGQRLSRPACASRGGGAFAPPATTAGSAPGQRKHRTG